MQKRNLKYAAGVSAAVSAALILVNCSSGNVDQATPPMLTVPGISSAVVYSFDLGAVDKTTHTYYVTDRTNKAIDVVSGGQVIAQFKQAFAGCNSTAAFCGVPGSSTAYNAGGGGNTCLGTNNSPGPEVDPLGITAMPGCLTVANASGFPVASFPVNNDTSGPDGLDVVGNFLYAGDVNALWFLDKTTGALSTKVTIASKPKGLRADEGCWDSTNNIYAISTPGAANPTITFLDTTVPGTPTIIVQVYMNGPDSLPSTGLEACFSDGTNFWVNNDGTTANPDGEANAIPISDILAIKAGGGLPKTAVFQGTATFALATPAATSIVTNGVLGSGGVMGTAAVTVYPLIAGCTPTGIAPGPGNELGTMCRPGAGAVPGATNRMDFVILNKTTGVIYYQGAGLGGGDQITYDAVSKRWFLANSRHTVTAGSVVGGFSCAGGSATCPLSPVLTVIADDGVAAPTLVGHFPSGNNAHSVAVDGALGIVYSPFTAPSATGGGAAFPGGGINIYNTK